MLQFFIFLTFPILSCYAAVIGTSRLYCMSCAVVPSDTTELDQFRVRQRLIQPRCRMESIECLPHQDTCATITMQVGPQHFWIGSGCDQRVNYDYPQSKDGCAEMLTVTRNFQPEYIMEDRRAVQRVCLCSNNLCNNAIRHVFSKSLLWLMILYLPPIINMLTINR